MSRRADPSHKTTVAIACAADANYALPLAVMLRSVGMHAAAGISIQAYVLDDGLTGEDRCKIAGSIPDNVTIHWRQPVSPVDGLPIWGRMPVTTYHKLTLAEWLPPELDRAIWLDCDVLVLSDISRLWRESGKLSPKPVVLAAQDPRVTVVSAPFGVVAWREIGLPANARYFNAGVLVIDLKQWRRQDIQRRTIEYTRSHAAKIYFWDQEALNAVLTGHWEALDPRWNRHPWLDKVFGNGNGNGSGTSPEPWILHFSGNLKPWRFAGGGHWRTLYRSYQDRTAWAGVRPDQHWLDGAVSWYETSVLRRILYPLERQTTTVLRYLTRSQAKRIEMVESQS